MSHEILIVDDQQDLAQMTADFLTDAGYTTRIAGDGRDALAQIQEALPDLLVLDVNMPEITAMSWPRC